MAKSVEHTSGGENQKQTSHASGGIFHALDFLNKAVRLQNPSVFKDSAVEHMLRLTSAALFCVCLAAVGADLLWIRSPSTSHLILGLFALLIGILPILLAWTKRVYLMGLLLCLLSGLAATLLAAQHNGVASPYALFLVIPMFWAWLMFSVRGALFVAGITLFEVFSLIVISELYPGPKYQFSIAGLSTNLSHGVMLLTVIALGLVSAFINWNESRQHEDDLVRRRDEALRANREKSEFVASIAHEIRNPLTGLMGMLELLSREELEATQAEMAGTARSSARNMLGLINDLLDLSKMEIGELRLIPEPVDVTEVFREMSQEYRKSAFDKGLDFQVSLPDRSFWLLADPTRLRQCLSNYLSNAIKFTQRGYIHARLKCEELDNGSVKVTMSVEDTGPGIPSSLHRKIFARFVQVEETQKSNRDGTGLGLAIVADLSRLQGGQAWVESEPGKGSTFHFEARFKRTSPIEVSVPELSAFSGSATILIADDSVGSQRVLTRVLQKLGYRTLSAENGSDALVLLLDHAVDLLLMDLHMPVKDGPTTLKEIRALPDHRRHVPTIALSADDNEADMARWVEADVDGFIAKPIDFAELDLTIRHILDKGRKNLTSPTAGESGSQINFGR